MKKENNHMFEKIGKLRRWAEFLDNFLTLASYPILMDKGKISALQAKQKA